jgi:GxxExxY protein
VEAGRRVSIEYAGHRVPNALIIDLLVEGLVIVELKAVQELHPIHSAQVMTYLRLSGRSARRSRAGEMVQAHGSE